MTSDEIAKYISYLAGIPDTQMPDIIDSNYLIDNILGFEDMDVTN